MGDKNNYKLQSNIENEISALKNVSSVLEETLSDFNSIQELLENGDWEGKSKDAFSALYSICRLYHEKIKNVSNDEVNILSSFKEEADGYMVSGNIPSKWRD